MVSEKSKYDSAYTKSDFQNSNFRKHYAAIQKFSTNKDDVITGLKQIHVSYAEYFEKECLPGYDLSEACVRYYTGDYYRELNRAIQDDDDSKLKLYMPLIRSMNEYLANHPTKEEMIVYRSSKLNEKQLTAFKKNKGRLFRHGMIVSTSKSAQVAAGWPGKCIVKYIIAKGCLNARDVESISLHKDEKEVTLPAYTAVEVIYYSSNGADKEYSQFGSIPILTLKVLDNKAVGIREKKGEFIGAFNDADRDYRNHMGKLPNGAKGVPSTVASAESKSLFFS